MASSWTSVRPQAWLVSAGRPIPRRRVNSGRRRDDDPDMEAINVSLPVQAMVMRVVRDRVDETTVAARAQTTAPADVILELSAAARNLLNLR